MRSVALLVGVLLIVPWGAAAVPREERRPYVVEEATATLAMTCVFAQEADEFAGPSTACFELDGSESRVRIALEDMTTLRVGAFYHFFDRGLSTLAFDLVCVSTEVDVPPGAWMLEVKVNGPVWSASQQFDCPASTATMGDVVAVFS